MEAACNTDLSVTHVGRPRLAAERADMGDDKVVRWCYKNRLVARFNKGRPATSVLIILLALFVASPCMFCPFIP